MSPRYRASSSSHPELQGRGRGVPQRLPEPSGLARVLRELSRGQEQARPLARTRPMPRPSSTGTTPWSGRCARKTRPAVYAFSRKRRSPGACCLRDGRLVLRDGDETPLVRPPTSDCPASTTSKTSCAAALVGRASACRPEHAGDDPGVPGPRTPARARRDRHTGPFRQRFQGDDRGRRRSRRSRASTARSSSSSAARTRARTSRSCGEPVRKKVRKALLIGSAAEKIRSRPRGRRPAREGGDVQGARPQGLRGGLAGRRRPARPGRTSWDMFDNFEQRGRTFKREVRSLARKIEGR